MINRDINRQPDSPIKKEDLEAVDVLVANIIKAIRNSITNTGCDRTFRSVVKSVTSKGYVISDESGTDRTVRCAIPTNTSLRVGSPVWVKIPCGNINEMHICGII